MSGELSPQVQNQIAQLQQVQQQAQILVSQKNQVELWIKETEMALEEVKKLDADAVIYRSVGDLLIKAEKEKTISDLTEKKDTLSLRLQTLGKQEERVMKRLTQLREQLKQLMGTPTAQ